MADKKPLILLTNDDGIQAPGLNTLHQAITGIASVEVVAPSEQCSATGHGISVFKDMSYKHIEMSAGNHGHCLTGMPADCVKLAVMRLFDQKPDLVLSGVNRGSNVGNNILYSGTVAAAIEGAMLGIPSMAISLAFTLGDTLMRFETAAKFALRLIPMVLEKGLPPGVVLNVNVPNVEEKDIKGIIVTRQGRGMFIDVMEPYIVENAVSGFRNKGEVMIYSPEGQECDDVAVRDGYVSITPLHYDLTQHVFRNTLRGWLQEKGFALTDPVK